MNQSNQGQELRALCDNYPLFSEDERITDEQWLAAQDFTGKIIAVYKGQVVAVGDDETAMRLELSKKYDVHPGRFVLKRLDQHAFRQKSGLLTSFTLGVLFVIICYYTVSFLFVSNTKATFQKIGSTVS